MRLSPLSLVLLIGLAPAVHAQEAQKVFTATGASVDAACDAVRKAARDWVKAGKSEGRARALLDDGKCDCKAVDDKATCTYDVRVSDEQHEEKGQAHCRLRNESSLLQRSPLAELRQAISHLWILGAA